MSTMVVGHRGSPEESPENTLASFKLAIRQGAQMVELDTRLTKDGVPVVIHDDTTTRTTGGGAQLKVEKSTLAELQNLDVSAGFPAYQGERLPTLEETLKELCPLIPVNVELKLNNPHARPLTFAVVEVLKKLGVTQRVIVSSFIHPALTWIKRFAPEVSTAPLIGDWTGPIYDEELMELLAAPPASFLPRAAVYDFKMVDRALVQRFHEKGGTVLVYTVNEEKDLKRMLEIGVDAIITNRPGLLCQLKGGQSA